MNWRRIRRLKASRGIGLVTAGTAIASAVLQLLQDHNAPLIIEPGFAFTVMAFLVAGARIWPVALLGFVVLSLQASPPTAAFLLAAGQTAGAGAAAWLLVKTRFNARLATIRDYFLLLGLEESSSSIHPQPHSEPLS